MKKNRTSRTAKAKTTRRAPARRTGEQPDQILAALERNILFRDVQPRVIKKTLSHFTPPDDPRRGSDLR